MSGVDASLFRSAEQCRDGLVRQVAAPVRWQECVERLAGEGAATFVEVGPGAVLAGLVRKILPGSRVLSVGDPASVEAVASELASAEARA